MNLRMSPKNYLSGALLVAGDVWAFIGAFLGGYIAAASLSIFFERPYMEFDLRYISSWLGLFMLLALGSIITFAQQGHYRQRTPWWEQLRTLTLTCLGMLLVAGFVLYLSKASFSRLWVSNTWLLCLPLLVSGRFLMRQVARWAGLWGSKVMIVGGPENTLETLYALHADTYTDYKIVSIWLASPAKRLGQEKLPPPYRGTPQRIFSSDIEQMLKGDHNTLIILAPDLHLGFDPEKLMTKAGNAGFEVAYVPPARGFSFYGMRTVHFFGSHTVMLKPLMRGGNLLMRAGKRGFDIAGSLMGIVLGLLPLTFLCWLLMNDDGPVFYSQQRVGQNGRLFRCWKFRTMVPTADLRLAEVLRFDPARRREWQRTRKLKNDPRITSFGKLLRRTSLDELPQLFNVLKGEMSLVGPRPVVPAEMKYYGAKKADYLAIRPGLTGLWQVSGRNDASYAYRVYLDTWYARHRSLWTDIVIILKTFRIVLNRKGAY